MAQQRETIARTLIEEGAIQTRVRELGAGLAHRPRRLTARGEATRDRIVSTANDLMLARGVAATTLEDVKTAAGVSKSQLYFHFPDKDSLVEAVVQFRAARVIAREEHQLTRLNSIRGLERWRDALVHTNASLNSAFGCGIGAT